MFKKQEDWFCQSKRSAPKTIGAGARKFFCYFFSNCLAAFFLDNTWYNKNVIILGGIDEKRYKALLDRIEEIETELIQVRKMAKRAENRAYRMELPAENTQENQKLDLIWGKNQPK